MLTVSGIGSCRIFTPLNLMKRRDHIAVGHEKAEWYTHSTHDVLQKLDVMNGTVEVTPAILPLLVHGIEKYHADVARPNFYEGTDVFVVEIASIKIYTAEGWYLQQWCVRDALTDTADNVEAAAIAGRAEMHVQTRDDLVTGMTDIAKKLQRPVIFVPHVNVVKDDGSHIPERALIRDAMQTVAERGVAQMFDPTPYVYEAGYDTAMVDSGHYRPDFELVIGRKLVDFVNENFSEEKAS